MLALMKVFRFEKRGMALWRLLSIEGETTTTKHLSRKLREAGLDKSCKFPCHRLYEYNRIHDLC